MYIDEAQARTSKFINYILHSEAEQILIRRTCTVFENALACFTQNLVQNLMSLVLTSRSKRKWQKMLKTKIVPKNAYVRVLEVKGKWFKRDRSCFFQYINKYKVWKSKENCVYWLSASWQVKRKELIGFLLFKVD